MKCVACGYWIGQPNVDCPSCHANQPPRTPPVTPPRPRVAPAPTAVPSAAPPAPVTASTGPEHYCTDCGSKVSFHAKYCPGCGKPQFATVSQSLIKPIRDILGGISTTTVAVVVMLLIGALLLAVSLTRFSERESRLSGAKQASSASESKSGEEVKEIPKPPVMPVVTAPPPPMPQADPSAAFAEESARIAREERAKDAVAQQELDYMREAGNILERKSTLPRLEFSNDILRALEIVEQMQRDLHALNAPPRFARFDALARSALGQWNTGLTRMHYGATTSNRAEIEEGKGIVEYGNSILAKARAELRQMENG